MIMPDQIVAKGALLEPLETAVVRLKASAKAYDDAIAKNGAGLSADRVAKLQSLMLTIDQTLLSAAGLPERAWAHFLSFCTDRKSRKRDFCRT